MKEFLSPKKLVQKKYSKNSKMNECKPINTPIECGNKLSKYEEREKMDLDLFGLENLVRQFKSLE